jgi:hypothetical protein
LALGLPWAWPAASSVLAVIISMHTEARGSAWGARDALYITAYVFCVFVVPQGHNGTSSSSTQRHGSLWRLAWGAMHHRDGLLLFCVVSPTTQRSMMHTDANGSVWAWCCMHHDECSSLPIVPRGTTGISSLRIATWQTE